MYASKKLIPIVWDMDPSELPAWLKSVQAIDNEGGTEVRVELQGQIVSIAQRIKEDKNQALLILGFCIPGSFCFKS